MEIQIHVPDVYLDTDLFDPLDLDAMLEEEMLNPRTRIQRALDGGRTADGAPFPPYKESYIRQIDSGRAFGKSPGEHNVNLTATSTMRNAMVTERIANGVRMFFA